MIPSYSTSFVKLWTPFSNDFYWHDRNGDGRIGEKETHYIPPQDWSLRAAQLVRSINPNFSGDSSKIQRFESLRDYFNHPEKRTFELQLEIDIRKLERMPERPKIFSDLLTDLKLIRNELQYTRFRYANEDELPEGTLAEYDLFTSTISVRHNPPTGILIHELDHAVTAHQRSERKAIENYPRTQNFVTSFEFYLDYPLRQGDEENLVSFKYDALDESLIFLLSPDPNQLACPNEASIAASLANEVHAFQTTARYWLYQMGIQEEDLNKIRDGGREKVKFLESLRGKSYEILRGTNINAKDAYQILLHYFDEGGLFYSNLGDYVQEVYEENNDPRFVKTDECIPPPQTSSGCGFSW